MGSSHFGELGGIQGSGSRSGSSSRRGKKSTGATDKPKQPQRGLGVAQLEKIRLHNQMNGGYLPSVVLHSPPPLHTNLTKEEDVRPEMAFSPPPPSCSSTTASPSSLYGLHPNIMMGFGDVERRDARYGESQSSATARTMSLNRNSSVIMESHPTVTLPLLRQPMEDWVQKKRRQDRCSESMGSSGQNSDSSDAQELDLDLKLSL